MLICGSNIPFQNSMPTLSGRELEVMIRQAKAKHTQLKAQKKKDELLMQEQSRKTSEAQTIIDGLDVMISQLMQENKQLQLEIDNIKGQNEKLQKEAE